MSKTPRTVQVPGEPTLPTDTSMAAAVEAQAVTTPPEPEINAEAETNAEVAALLAERAALQAELDALKAKRAATVAPAPAPVAAPAKNAAVQTDKGWLVPDTFGAPIKKA